ncbi:hypothetical protein [Teredinibacter turnerae]|uniref:hypothetical protein n=1 Tax=Teredinibacter turnerae TaxID=2426 RepID=UPI00036CA7F9|nr:hypothetical protein [Teredinibacter turnerae]
MSETIWVKIETTKGNDDVWSFKGLMWQRDFEKITSNEQRDGYFQLNKVYWISTIYDDSGNSEEEKLYQYGKGKLEAFRGDLYLKVEHLVSIAPIDGASELERYQKRQNSPLRAVTPIRS